MSSETWIDVAAIDDVPEGDTLGASCRGQGITLYKVEGEVFATAGLCTHGAAHLCDGFLDGFEIECPLHQGRFDIRSGKALNEPLTEDIRTFAVRIDGGRVLIGTD
ncbi:non-heme iron oxygenase ferredoxin subunit [Pinisolibacter aquiterrae]|uniref:non-heme iron oxygenase ferredoxin subunit n=1 Tax=Pinisolibacter aquiterrae TaxID=2815579 RepID=UPI001C3D881C|nr:non-heme iron oxygenase ferredoxin subunit [Pinisolibacter aquiterrae]MBV5265016.1 non-heme iron oxygenase ferredoxin subunit [Pinisolibacter aquiterrae]MCC8235602.1 non-heme iron oxygenase ferredoxin subunit [Pinisolibacter aquiterrae]